MLPEYRLTSEKITVEIKKLKIKNTTQWDIERY